MFGMKDLKNTCFVCKKSLRTDEAETNMVVNLPVCEACKGTDAEKKAEKQALDSLADGFVCGCI